MQRLNPLNGEVGRWCACVLKSIGASIMVPRFLPLSSFASFCCYARSLLSLSSCSPSFTSSFLFFLSFLFFMSFLSFLFFVSFLHAIVEFPSLSFASLLVAAFVVFFSFPRCTIIEFAELKAPPPPMHYVILWGLLSFGQIAFLKRQVAIQLSHTTVA